MKNIMFNDKLLLTQAVLNGTKTMTRRVIKRVDFIKYYKELKRDRFIAILKEHPHASAKELKTIMEEKIKDKQR